MLQRRRIRDEWKRNLLKNRLDITSNQLDWTSELMDRAIPDALVEGYEPLLVRLEFRRPAWLAAAIRCNASVIMTFNGKDFPAEVLHPFGLEAQHPDAFVENQGLAAEAT